MKNDQQLVDLTIHTRGLITRAQLSVAGYSSESVRRRVDRRLWQLITPQVVLLHSKPVERLEEISAAAMHFANGVVTGSAALELHGLPGPDDLRIDLITPRGGKVTPSARWKIHTSENDIPLLKSWPPQTELAFSTAFAMGTARTARQGAFYGTWALSQGLVTFEQLNQVCDNLGFVRIGRFARLRFAIMAPGAMSVHELDFLNLCKQFGLPQPALQQPRVDSQGKRRYLDALFTSGSKSVAVEIDGVGHLEFDVKLDDAVRSNEMALQNIPIVRIPGIALRSDPSPFMRQIRQFLESA